MEELGIQDDDDGDISDRMDEILNQRREQQRLNSQPDFDEESIREEIEDGMPTQNQSAEHAKVSDYSKHSELGASMKKRS